MSDHDTAYHRRIIEEKLRDSLTPGFVAVFTEVEARIMGAFDEPATDLEYAKLSALDSWEAQ